MDPEIAKELRRIRRLLDFLICTLLYKESSGDRTLDQMKKEFMQRDPLKDIIGV